MESRLGHNFSRMRVESAVLPISVASPGVSQPQDPHEQQADRMADDFARMFRHEDSPSPRQEHDWFAKSIKKYLNEVRIHTTSEASDSASAVGALAFTVGPDIVFSQGQYAPDTHIGRRLLAHELMHVIQQAMSVAGDLSSIRINRAPAAAPSGLSKALNGGHSDVIKLTRESDWRALDLSAKDAATLIIILLIGGTNDKEELAGLEIFKKNIEQKRLDDTLLVLDKAGRFGQVFDDFDGKEYVKMLDQLSENIERFYIRKIFLDKLIKEDRMNTDEERAVVTLLANAPASHAKELLEQNGREEYFRKEIDDQRLALWFERVIASANEQRRQDLKDKTPWRAIFDAQAKKCRKPGLSDAEAQRLFQENMNELSTEVTRELMNYQASIEFAAELNSDAKKTAELNKKFEKSLDELLDRKRIEFCLELKYDKEFSLSMSEFYRASWTLDDMKKMRDFLADFPAEILELNPAFQGFVKEATHPSEPWVGGSAASDSSRITLISMPTVTHEFGHVIHQLDPQLLKDFQALSQWEAVDAAMVTALIANDSKFQNVINEVDKNSKDKSKSPSKRGVIYDQHTYITNRYGSGYWRFPSPLPDGAKFVSDYAATDPQDDFAETFEWYIEKPNDLRDSNFAKKYVFIHVDVFVKLVFTKLKERLVKTFDDKKEALISQITSARSLDDSVDDKILNPMRKQMIEDMDATLQPSVDAANLKLAAARPKPDMTQAEAILQTYLSRLDAFSWFATEASRRLDDYEAKLQRTVKPEFEAALKAINSGVARKYTNELIKLLEQKAQAITTGTPAVAGSWPEADPVTAKYEKSITVIEQYLPFFVRIEKAMTELRDFDVSFTFQDDPGMNKMEWTTLKKFPLKDPRRAKIAAEVFHHLDPARTELSDIRKSIIPSVEQAVPFKEAKVKNPEDVLSNIKKDMVAFAKTLK